MAGTLPVARRANGDVVEAEPVVLVDSGGNPVLPGIVSQFFNGAKGAADLLAGNATFTGATRDVGVPAGTSQGLAYFNAFFLTDQTGTAFIDGSNDGANWYVIATAPIVANTALILSVPVMTRYHRARVLNGATPETFLWVNTSYTAA